MACKSITIIWNTQEFLANCSQIMQKFSENSIFFAYIKKKL